MDEKELLLVGTSYQVAPVAVRERYAARLTDALSRLPTSRLELAVLATCNRFEVYASGPASDLERLEASVEAGPYRAEGVAAAEHLIRVACGIESAVLGDVQVLSQIKQARAKTSGAVLDRLFLAAIRAGKKARAETEIGFGRASIGSAVAGILKRRSDLRRVLVLGAGDAAKALGAHLGKLGVELTWMNRTESQAAKMVARFGGAARPWDQLADALGACDALVAATRAPQPILTKAMLERATVRLVVDAGVPRNVEPGVSVDVVNVDSIREQQEHVLSRRRAAIPAVERIVAAALEDWNHRRGEGELEAVIRTLYTNAEDSARSAADAIAAADDRAEVERIVRRSIRQLLHEPVHRLRALR